MSFVIKSGYQKGLEDYQGFAKFDYWREVVNNEFVSVTCDPYDDSIVEDFDANLKGGVGLGDIRFSEVVSKPQIVRRTPGQIAKTGESDFLINFQVSNQCSIEQKGKEGLLVPGSFALYDSSEPYSLSFAEDFHQFIVQMPREILTRHLVNPEKYTAVPINASSGLGLVLKDFVFSLACELSSSEVAPSALLSENLVSLIALSFSSTVCQNDLTESECVKDALMRRIHHFIETNLFDPNLNNTRIAESQGISIRYLYKLFQEESQSIHEMILDKRLSAAHNLLLSSGDHKLTIESVAYHVGFSGAPQFSRAFKLRYGMCPKNVMGH